MNLEILKPIKGPTRKFAAGDKITEADAADTGLSVRDLLERKFAKVVEPKASAIKGGAATGAAV